MAVVAIWQAGQEGLCYLPALDWLAGSSGLAKALRCPAEGIKAGSHCVHPPGTPHWWGPVGSSHPATIGVDEVLHPPPRCIRISMTSIGSDGASWGFHTSNTQPGQTLLARGQPDFLSLHQHQR